MAHNIRHFTYSETVNRKTVQKDLDQFAMMEDYGEGCTGLPSPIRWCENDICDSREDAEDYIKDHDRGNYDQLAVRFRDVTKVKSKRIDELTQKRDEAYGKWLALDKVLYTKTVKSAFVGCRKCSSRLASPYLWRNECPVCHEDLRSPSTIERIKAAQERYKRIDAQLHAEKVKAGQKHARIKWLVKIEYHT